MSSEKRQPPQRFDPAPFSNILKQMDAFFHESRKRVQTAVGNRRIPIHLHETRDQAIIKAELPGYRRDQIQLEVIGRDLRITAIDPKSSNEKDPDARRIERVVSLPFSFSRKEVRATHRDGLLTVTIPKKSVNGHQIDID